MFQKVHFAIFVYNFQEITHKIVKYQGEYALILKTTTSEVRWETYL